MITIPGVPPWMMWAGFILLVLIMLAIDLGVFNRKSHAISIKEALLWALVWFSLAMIFNAWIYFEFGTQTALEFFTGYLIEKSLSVDNLFVFLVIFTAFGIPAQFQHRVLFWGIIGAIVTRGIFIGLGSAILEHFTFAFAIFGAVLLYAAYRMQFGKETTFDQNNSKIVTFVKKFVPVADTKEEHFFTHVNGKFAITMLFLVLIVIELTDIVFAFDSIPAIFAITTDPFIVFTSNIFAILGLRSLYFVLADIQGMFEYLKTGLAIILLFIGVKLILKPLHVEVPIVLSLTFIVAVLLVSILISIIGHRKKIAQPVADAPAATPMTIETLPTALHPPPLPVDHSIVIVKKALPALKKKTTAKKKKRK
jgi:tellurite resistance protein TerC